MFNQAQLDGILREIEVNPTMAEWKEDIIFKANSYMNKEPIEYTPDSSGYLLDHTVFVKGFCEIFSKNFSTPQ